MLGLARPMPCPSLPSFYDEHFSWMPNEVQWKCLHFILQAELYFLKEREKKQSPAPGMSGTLLVPPRLLSLASPLSTIVDLGLDVGGCSSPPQAKLLTVKYEVSLGRTPKSPNPNIS